MTREEIIEQLENAIELIKQDGKDWLDDRDIPMLEECIKALSQEPCDDAISREAVIIECIKYADHEHNVQFKKEVSETRKHDGQVIIYACDYFKTFVEKLPSVTHKSGKWIEHPEIETTTPEYLMFYECSECGDKPCFCKSDIHKKRFCSNCGAKMESEE